MLLRHARLGHWAEILEAKNTSTVKSMRQLYALQHHSLTLLFLGWQILPLALLGGLTNKTAEQALSALSSGANAARQSMHALHVGAAGVLGEASSHDIEGCELRYMVCDTLPWQYVASQAWMG